MYKEKTSLRDVKDSVLNPSVVAVVPRVLKFLLCVNNNNNSQSLFCG